MRLRDPVAVYNAENNVEAHLVRDVLAEAGIGAFVIEDLSQVGVWAFGLLPQVHKPQVWIERADGDRAKPILEDYSRRTAARRGVGTREGPAATPITAVCEECGKTSTYRAGQRNSVQVCAHCGAFIDVGDGSENIGGP